MDELFRNLLGNEKGLTLIELLAVIVILAIIAAIAIPSIGAIINNQRDKAILADIANMVATAKIQMSDNECEDDICTYDPAASINELSFHSSRFTEGEVNFTSGSSPDVIEIFVNVPATAFKGKRKEDYANLVGNPNQSFTEADLLAVLNQ